MPTFNSSPSRDDMAHLIPEEVEQQIFTSAEEQSVILRLATRLRNGSRNQQILKVDESLPVAYFVEGDSGLIQTSKMTWEDKILHYHKIGVIVPIPDDIGEDMDVDYWGTMMPKIAAAFASKIDGAVLEGTSVPGSYQWPTNIAAGCASAGHSVDLSNIIGASGDLYDALLSEGGVNSKLEDDGFEATAHVCALSMKSKLRGLRGSDDHPIFKSDPMGGIQGVTNYTLDGAPCLFPKNGCLTPASNLLIAGDWQHLVHSFRRELTFKVLDQATINDESGATIFNFGQQETRGLRVTMRWGWQIPNPVNRTNSDSTTRYPFAKLVP